MRDHTFDAEEAALRPKSARVDDPLSEHAGSAAAAGRVDALNPADILGLQRTAGNGGVTSLMDEDRSPVHDVISSGGRPLDREVRTDMEDRLGADFSDVRVHDDGAAHESATSVNAHAYTVGSNVVFQRDKYDPSSSEGKLMLAHELTHVVQQRNGPVDGSAAPGGISVSDPSDRFEREAASNAERAMSAPATTSDLSAASAGAVQRHAEDETGLDQIQRQDVPEEEEEPTAQGTFVQRQDAPEEDEEPPA
jgi:hypothetical protein